MRHAVLSKLGPVQWPTEPQTTQLVKQVPMERDLVCDYPGGCCLELPLCTKLTY